jgi:hypothetical protein
MILGKLFNTAVLASLWNLANTCSSLRKIQGRPQAAASRYESRKPVIITDFSILATRQPIKNPHSAPDGSRARPEHQPLRSSKKRDAARFSGKAHRPQAGSGAQHASPLKNKWTVTSNPASSQSKLS